MPTTLKSYCLWRLQGVSEVGKSSLCLTRIHMFIMKEQNLCLENVVEDMLDLFCRQYT